MWYLMICKMTQLCQQQSNSNIINILPTSSSSLLCSCSTSSLSATQLEIFDEMPASSLCLMMKTYVCMYVQQENKHHKLLATKKKKKKPKNYIQIVKKIPKWYEWYLQIQMATETCNILGKHENELKWNEMRTSRKKMFDRTDLTELNLTQLNTTQLSSAQLIWIQICSGRKQHILPKCQRQFKWVLNAGCFYQWLCVSVLHINSWFCLSRRSIVIKLILTRTYE